MAGIPLEALDSIFQICCRGILIAEHKLDAADSLRSLVEVLVLGHEVYQACDGEQAIAAVQAYHPDIVFMDIGMPGVDGLEATRRIRELALAAPPLIVALTGWGQESDRQRWLHAGIDHHFVKPIDFNALCELLEIGKAARRPRAARLRRVRRAAISACLVVLGWVALAPGWAHESGGARTGAPPTVDSIKADARRFGERVHRDSVDLGHRIAVGAREAGHEVGRDARRFARYVRDWWAGLRGHSGAHGGQAPGA